MLLLLVLVLVLLVLLMLVMLVMLLLPVDAGLLVYCCCCWVYYVAAAVISCCVNTTGLLMMLCFTWSGDLMNVKNVSNFQLRLFLGVFLSQGARNSSPSTPKLLQRRRRCENRIPHQKLVLVERLQLK
jgi:hypothetical protein